MCTYLKNNPVKIHPNLVWNDRVLGFLEEGFPNKKNNKMSSDMRSVPDPKTILLPLS